MSSTCSQLERAFQSFCGDGHKDLDGKSFVKLLKDCHLIDKKFTPTDADLIFAKSVPKGQRRMSLEQFAGSLRHVADKKSVSVDAVHNAVSSSQGPVLHATQADAVRFHDDKNTYTGVHVNGGPEAVAVGVGTAADQSWKRQPHQISSRGADEHSRGEEHRPSTHSKSSPEPAHSAASRDGSHVLTRVLTGELRSEAVDTFYMFCGDGRKDMDGKTFAKLCKDSGLLDKYFTATDADLIFARVVAKGQRRMSEEHFLAALDHVAEKKSASLDDVYVALSSSRGPVLNATQADAVRFHDDKTTYTGVHVNGGPDSVAVGVGTVADRSWKRPEPTSSTSATDRRPSAKSRTGRPESANLVAAGSKRDNESRGALEPANSDVAIIGSHAVTQASAGDLENEVIETFRVFCAEGHKDIDGRTFAKVCKDSGLFDKQFTSTDADLIFAKVVPKGQRRMRLTDFFAGLIHVAEKKAVDLSAVHKAVSSSSGPVLNATQTDAVRFHDDKSTYTGTHVNGGPESVVVGAGTVADQSWKRQPEQRAKCSDAELAERRLAKSERHSSSTASLTRSERHSSSTASLQKLQSAAALSDEVKHTFKMFCGDGQKDMDGKSFTKLCKDSQLIDKRFTATDADLIFAKAVPKGQHRRLSLEQFAAALGYVAEKKYMNLGDVQKAVERTSGPVLHATQTDAVRFHDDKSTYTGVHVNGGPEAVAVGAGTLADQSWKRPEQASSKVASERISSGNSGCALAGVRTDGPGMRRTASGNSDGGVELLPAGSPVQAIRRMRVAKNQASAGTDADEEEAAVGPSVLLSKLEEVFKSFCGGHPDLDGKSFSKMCKDSGLYNKSFTQTDAELAFAKVLAKGTRRITLRQLEEVLHLVAEKKGEEYRSVLGAVSLSGGPVLLGTRGAARFHDDKSTYTGTHVYGGPEAVAVGAGTAADQSWKRR